MRTIMYLLDWLGKLFSRACRAIVRFESAMRLKYHPKWLAALVLLVIFVTASITLFFPPYLGLSNDGSFDSVLADTGLARASTADGTAYFNYYERTYSITPSASVPDTTPLLLRVVVGIAVQIDRLLTRDAVFDLRFLAGLYLVTYLLVLYPLLNVLLDRVKLYTEGLVIAVLCVLVFGDTSLITRFASFYTQPLELILLLVLMNCVFLIPRNKDSWLGGLIMAGATVLLMNVNTYCALAGIVFSLAYWQKQQLKLDLFHRVGCILLALVLCVISVAETAGMLENQTSAQKYDQMTRGILFQCDNPESALESFQIDPRYSILAETYADQSYPVVNLSSGVLDKDFLDRYNTPDVMLYYMWHPLYLMNMFNIGVHNAFISRSDYSGNYEVDAGLPPRAKALFLSAWSIFKEQTAPKTGGLVLLLGVAFLAVRHKKKSKDGEQDQKERSFTALCIVLFLFAIVEMLTVLIMSGDSELIRESFLMGCCIDLLSVLFVTEILHKLKIFSEE